MTTRRHIIPEPDPAWKTAIQPISDLLAQEKWVGTGRRMWDRANEEPDPATVAQYRQDAVVCFALEYQKLAGRDANFFDTATRSLLGEYDSPERNLTQLYELLRDHPARLGEMKLEMLGRWDKSGLV